MAATTVAEQTAIREYNPLFQSMGTEEAAMAVANRMEEVAAGEMTVTAMTTTAIAIATATATATTEMDEENTKEVATEEGTSTTATEDAAEDESSFGGGASGRQIWDQSRMFDPGIFLAYFQI